jgi:DNA-binding protein WhiA
MSFAFEVKQQLMKDLKQHCEAISILQGLLMIHGSVHIQKEGVYISFQTNHLSVARFIISLNKSLYSVSSELLSKTHQSLKHIKQYHVNVYDHVEEIIEELSLLDEDGLVSNVLVDTDCGKIGFLKGVFLASGSINSPTTSSYHFEIATVHEYQAMIIQDILDYFQLNSKVLKRKKGYIVYMKESEKIGDFLRLVQAVNALMEFEDERIKRDFINSINRVMNMEIANQNKTLEAANEQLKNIRVIEQLLGVERCTESMQEAIFLRNTYPESSLNELSDFALNHYNKVISKSALNHRFRKISDLANELMEALNE